MRAVRSAPAGQQASRLLQLDEEVLLRRREPVRQARTPQQEGRGVTRSGREPSAGEGIRVRVPSRRKPMRRPVPSTSGLEPQAVDA